MGGVKSGRAQHLLGNVGGIAAGRLTAGAAVDMQVDEPGRDQQIAELDRRAEAGRRRTIADVGDQPVAQRHPTGADRVAGDHVAGNQQGRHATRLSLSGLSPTGSTVKRVNSFGGFDPDRAMEKLRKLAADAPAYMADGFGRAVHNAPPERLEQLMRSPARKPALDGIFWQMPKQVNTEVAKNMTTTIRWRITGRPDDGVDVYQLVVDKGQVKTVKGESGDPKLTVTMDAVEFLKLASGNLDPMQAYFKGRIELTGDIMVAAKLAQLFKMPGGAGKGADERRRWRLGLRGSARGRPDAVLAAALELSPPRLSSVGWSSPPPRRRSNCAPSSSASVS